jgi:hypothetical protein
MIAVAIGILRAFPISRKVYLSRLNLSGCLVRYLQHDRNGALA